MVQHTPSLVLTNSSLLLCILGLIMTYVLLQEQQTLAGTDAAIAVSTGMPFHLVFTINSTSDRLCT